MMLSMMIQKLGCSCNGLRRGGHLCSSPIAFRGGGVNKDNYYNVESFTGKKKSWSLMKTKEKTILRAMNKGHEGQEQVYCGMISVPEASQLTRNPAHLMSLKVSNINSESNQTDNGNQPGIRGYHSVQARHLMIETTTRRNICMLEQPHEGYMVRAPSRQDIPNGNYRMQSYLRGTISVTIAKSHGRISRLNLQIERLTLR